MSWYLLQVVSRQERDTKDRLKKKGYLPYCPFMYRDRRGKAKEWTMAMWPGYMFVYLVEGRDDFAGVLRTDGVIKYYSNGYGESRRYQTASNEVIDYWKSQEDEKGYHGNRRIEYKPGDAVETTDDSAYRHYRGITLKTEKERLQVLFDIVGGGQKAIWVEKKYLRPYVA
jgi:transcription antitermination factor NusG